MSLLSLSSIAVSFGASDILRGVTVEVNPGDRVGLVGSNGAGKTTLLRILAGALEPTAGRRSVARSIRTALVEQVSSIADPAASLPSATLIDEARDAIRDVLDLEAELEAAAAGLGGEDPNRDQHYASLLNQFEARGGFTYPGRLKQILSGLGFDEDEWSTPLGTLSGGQRGRLALARGLLAQPDLLIMDEPTNHLDLAGLRWLEGFVSHWPGSLVVTSHDRYFLDTVATQIWLLEDGRLSSYPGNYTRFEGLRKSELEDLQKRHDAQQIHIASEEAFIRRYGAGQRAREAHGRALKLARVERIAAPVDRQKLNVKLAAARSGDIALATRALAAGYGTRTILEAGDLELRRGARVAIVGPNGSGKSTLLKTLTGELAPVSGSVTLGSKVHIDLYHQEAENLDSYATVIEEILGTGKVDDQEARNFLGRFLFSGADVGKRVSQLSGGERGRLAIARLVLSGANLLLLDEPTNHLDISSREALEEALDGYPGTLIFASHDRRLISRLATRVWAVRDGRLVDLDGGLETYERLLRTEAEARDAARTVRTAISETGEANREQAKATERAAATATRALAVLEAKIEEQETALTTLAAEIEQASATGNFAAISALGRRFEAAQDELNRLMDRWSDLAGQG